MASGAEPSATLDSGVNDVLVGAGVLLGCVAGIDHQFRFGADVVVINVGMIRCNHHSIGILENLIRKRDRGKV